MYEHLRGALVERQPTRAVVEVGGVGFELIIPLSTFEALPAPRADTILYTHLHVREDALKLYGFADRDQRRFFRRLLDVPGIGPAVALSILSATTYAQFRGAIVTEDLAALTRMKGVGRKLAQRMVLELKDALAKEAPENLPEQPSAAMLIADDAVAALVTLGFKQGAAVREVERIIKSADGPPDVEEVVRQALRSTR